MYSLFLLRSFYFDFQQLYFRHADTHTYTALCCLAVSPMAHVSPLFTIAIAHWNRTLIMSISHRCGILNTHFYQHCLPFTNCCSTPPSDPYTPTTPPSAGLASGLSLTSVEVPYTNEWSTYWHPWSGTWSKKRGKVHPSKLYMRVRTDHLMARHNFSVFLYSFMQRACTRYLWTFPCTHSTFTICAFPSALPLTTHWWIEVWLDPDHTNAWYGMYILEYSPVYGTSQLDWRQPTSLLGSRNPHHYYVALLMEMPHCSCNTLAQVLFLHLWPQYHQVEGEKRETLGVGKSRKLWGFVRKSTGPYYCLHYLRYQQRAGNLWFI